MLTKNDIDLNHWFANNIYRINKVVGKNKTESQNLQQKHKLKTESQNPQH